MDCFGQFLESLFDQEYCLSPGKFLESGSLKSKLLQKALVKRRDKSTTHPLAIRVFRRLISGARTVNQLNNVVIRVQRRATPLETTALACALEEKLTPFPSGIFMAEKSASITQLVDQVRLREAKKTWARELKRAAFANDSWKRRLISRGLALYVREDLPTPRPLIVGFSGAAQRLMMPISQFLDSISELDSDLLLLWARERSRYQEGIPSLGHDLDGSLENLSALIRDLRYESISVVGTSGGGLPAIIFASLYIDSPFLVVGSGHPVSSDYHLTWKRLIETHALKKIRPKGLILVGDEAPERDHHAGEYLSKALALPLITKPGGHNPIHSLAVDGKLAGLLGRLRSIS